MRNARGESELPSVNSKKLGPFFVCIRTYACDSKTYPSSTTNTV